MKSGFLQEVGVVVVLFLGAVVIYNKLVANKNMVAEGWSGIDGKLKPRAGLVFNPSFNS